MPFVIFLLVFIALLLLLPYLVFFKAKKAFLSFELKDREREENSLFQDEGFLCKNLFFSKVGLTLKEDLTEEKTISLLFMTKKKKVFAIKEYVIKSGEKGKTLALKGPFASSYLLVGENPYEVVEKLKRSRVRKFFALSSILLFLWIMVFDSLILLLLSRDDFLSVYGYQILSYLPLGILLTLLYLFLGYHYLKTKWQDHLDLHKNEEAPLWE